jgi:tRNA dimethylallyltransferase
MQEYPLLIVLGPTASGKTKLAVQLALALDGEIISADSRQVFRGMNIGTGKDLDEYCAGGKAVPYHLIDICDAGEKYNVHRFKEDFYRSFTEITTSGKLPILCGGTGMYIHSILQKHDYTSIPVNPELRGRLEPDSLEMLQNKLSAYPEDLTTHADQSTRKRLIRAIEIADHMKTNGLVQKQRVNIRPVIIGLTESVLIRRQKIHDRLENRFEQGLITEVEELLKQGVSEDMLTFYGLEYKMVVSYLKHNITYEELKERLYTGICQYAKRQMTFFRKMEKDGVNIRWYQAGMPAEELCNLIIKDVKYDF